MTQDTPPHSQARPAAKPLPMRRNVALLALCQALAMTCSALVISITALTGSLLAPDPSLSTLPLGLQFLAMMAVTYPASRFMERRGRRAGFTLGAILGALAGLLGVFAITRGSFALYCLTSLLFGAFMAHAYYYRFAAADTANAAFRSRAISLVMAGGVLAAFLGPLLARLTLDLFAPTLYAGGYLAITGLCLASLVILRFVQIPPPPKADAAKGGRPFGVIARQPVFIVAVLCATIGFGAMNLVMAVTPTAMAAHDHGFDASATVIQWHVFAMYAPSFFTGAVIARVGLRSVLLSGAVMMLACVAVNLHGDSHLHFLSALVLLGCGWNFLFVGGTTLLTEAYRPEEKAKVQAINDVMVFATVAVTALSSGWLFASLGWHAVNLGIVAPVLLALIAVLTLRRPGKAAVAA